MNAVSLVFKQWVQTHFTPPILESRILNEEVKNKGGSNYLLWFTSSKNSSTLARKF